MWRLRSSGVGHGGHDLPRHPHAVDGVVLAAWHLTSSKVGISATQLQREMELGSYQTAWAMLHRYRTVMV